MDLASNLSFDCALQVCLVGFRATCLAGLGCSLGFLWYMVGLLYLRVGFVVYFDDCCTTGWLLLVGV